MTLKRGPHRLVSEIEGRLAPLETDFHRAYWSSQIEANAENDRRRAELEVELRRLKGDPDALAEVESALDEGMHEPILMRQLEVLRLALSSNQMDEGQRAEMVRLSTEVESEFATFRPEVEGRRLTENDVDEVLRTSEDEEERRLAWTASKDIGKRVGSRVRELARVRNAVALGRGFSDYYQMALELQEMSEDWLFRLLDELEESTTAAFQAFKSDLDAKLKDRFGVERLQPWHYADPFFQAVPPDAGITLDHLLRDLSAEKLAVETFAAWGIDIASVMSGSDLYPRELKCQHAFCLDIDRSTNDVRILANIVPGERWVEVMLHESGHAAYDVSINKKLPYLLRRAAHTFVTEAIAILSGRLARDPAWLMKIAGVPEREIAPIAGDLRHADKVQSLLFTRWVLVMAHFERDLYRDPEADLDDIWWDHVERFQLIERPGNGSGEGAWGAKIHIAAAPVYYHNYLLGELLATQLHRTIESRYGDLVGNPGTGAFLKNEIFAHGNSMRWDRLIEAATGKPLSPKDFVASVS